MKKIFMFAVLVCGALSLNSCLEYDEPGDELNLNQKLYEYTDPVATDDEGAGDEGEGGEEGDDDEFKNDDEE